jgi:hypothetical protein
MGRLSDGQGSGRNGEAYAQCCEGSWEDAMSFNIKHKFIAAIEQTHNPMAPIILQNTYKSVEQAGSMFASIAERNRTADIKQDLLQAFPENMDDVAASPEFIVAVCALLAQALIQYGKKL